MMQTEELTEIGAQAAAIAERLRADLERQRQEMGPEKWDARRQQALEAESRETVGRLYSYSGIPKELSRVTFDSCDWPAGTEHIREMYQGYREWYPVDGNNLVLMGNIGVGKTRLALCIVNRLIVQEKMQVYFVGFADFVECQSIHADRAARREMRERLRNTRVLVIDDLARAALSERGGGATWWVEKLWATIDWREKRSLSTIYTVNYDRATLEKKVGAATVSRIFDGADLVEMRGPNRRKMKVEGVPF